MEALIWTCIQVEEMLESTAKSEMDRWIVRVKLAKLGTVNSTEHRNPKEPKVASCPEHTIIM